MKATKQTYLEDSEGGRAIFKIVSKQYLPRNPFSYMDYKDCIIFENTNKSIAVSLKVIHVKETKSVLPSGAVGS